MRFTLNKARQFIGGYLYNCFLSVSQMLNVVLFFGDPDESVSGRCGRGREKGNLFFTVLATILDILWFPFQRDHCAKSIERDEGYRQLVGRKYIRQQLEQYVRNDE